MSEQRVSDKEKWVIEQVVIDLQTKSPNKFAWINLLILAIFLICFSSVSCSGQTQYLLLFEQRTGSPDWLRRIYSVSPDGSNLNLLIELDKTAAFYWLSPNSNYLAVLNKDVQEVPSTDSPNPTLSVIDISTKQTIININGAGQTRSEHFTNESSVAWSPQGDKLAFVKNSSEGMGTDLWLYDLNTDSIAPLTNDADFDLEPTWSPRGEQIAFVTRILCQENIENCSSDEASWELAVVDAAGSNKQILSDFHNNGLLSFSGWTTLLCNLLWSPNERYIVLENDCGILLGPPTTKEVFVISTDSSLVLKLTDFVDEQDDAVSTIFRYSFYWAPSSTTLFVGYSKIPYNPNDFYRGGFLFFEADKFTSSPVKDMPTVLGNTARWSSDGQYLAWHTANISQERRTKPGPIIIGQVVNNQISELVGLTNLPYGSCQDYTIIWSPDGQYISYAAVEEDNICDDNKRSIVVVSISDARIIDITESLEGDNHPIGWIQLDTLQP